MTPENSQNRPKHVKIARKLKKWPRQTNQSSASDEIRNSELKLRIHTSPHLTTPYICNWHAGRTWIDDRDTTVKESPRHGSRSILLCTRHQSQTSGFEKMPTPPLADTPPPETRSNFTYSSPRLESKLPILSF
jgi:hypothetical protein